MRRRHYLRQRRELKRERKKTEHASVLFQVKCYSFAFVVLEEVGNGNHPPIGCFDRLAGGGWVENGQSLNLGEGNAHCEKLMTFKSGFNRITFWFRKTIESKKYFHFRLSDKH